MNLAVAALCIVIGVTFFGSIMYFFGLRVATVVWVCVAALYTGILVLA